METAGRDALPNGKREAVIDIGSNSVRLAVFERFQRSLTPLFNEKVLCGLARGMDRENKLSAEAVAMALANLQRFTRLCQVMGVDDVELLATAAVRDASNGKQFASDVEALTGYPVRILSGEEEARYAAYGVAAGIPDADGIVGDLGGGSLELIKLNHGQLGESVTLPLGLLRMPCDSSTERQAVVDKIDAAIAQVGWLGDQLGSNFYAVGGAWRSLARVDIEQNEYPLHVIHGYTRAYRDIEDMLKVIARLGSRSLAAFGSVSKRRLETMPMAALIMSRVLAVVQPENVVFCGYGLREGSRYAKLSDEARALDPLEEMAAELARREGRFGDLGEPLIAWTAPLFDAAHKRWERLRRAACYLSDVAWREHPDYRAEQSLLRLLRQPFEGADHYDRGFLGMASYIRYGGPLGSAAIVPLFELIDQEATREATILGAALRLGYTLSGGTREVLSQSRLELDGRQVNLIFEKDAWVPGGDVVERRLAAVRKAVAARYS
ncbi:Ppx/GppA family phosphatase [Limibacillus halophilus]|uniref:Exopolyphosphatase/guanosine-5'-triphosphate, 3'-diphosphate pyrophosphatase n=1 Tax=Limibacillus halophilus TaxID=1579333 RepID=A0A839STE9_9PROT|nr:Ppx/GppA family phosphatase [Limibacillus halophilus]MBB3065034.1 exopolyphosphatase/guanosine-5'-triphosphate,3'-diphosphate pyrophosphatase [Limibacillus halophilus]